MNQYPEPHVRAWINEPLPVHDFPVSEIEAEESGELVAEVGDETVVEYRYVPIGISVDLGDAESGAMWEPSDDVEWFDKTHKDVWDMAIEAYPQDDWIDVTEFVTGPNGDTAQIDASWVLDKITISVPR